MTELNEEIKSLDPCPPEEFLRAFATGTLKNRSLHSVILSHLEFCPSCRQQVREFKRSASSDGNPIATGAEALRERQLEHQRAVAQGPTPGTIWRTVPESEKDLFGPLVLVLQNQGTTVTVAEVSEDIAQAIHTDMVLEPHESALRFRCMIRTGNIFNTSPNSLTSFAGALSPSLINKVQGFCKDAERFDENIPLSKFVFLKDSKGRELMRRQGITSGLLVTKEDDPRLGFLGQSKARTAYLSKAPMEPLSEKVVSIDRKKNIKWFVKTILPLAAMIVVVVFIGKSVQIFTEREPSPETSAESGPGKKRAPGERASQRVWSGEEVPKRELFRIPRDPYKQPVEAKRSAPDVAYSLKLPPSRRDHMLLEAVKSGDLGEVKQLLQDGAFVNCRDSEGQTPLIIAVRGGYLGTVKLLLESGAATGMTDKNGKTALDWAVATRQKEAADLLTDYLSGKEGTH